MNAAKLTSKRVRYSSGRKKGEMTTEKTQYTIGCKLLKADGTSLNGKFQYLRGRWQTVPGNGAYIAVTAGLTVGGTGPVLAYFECAKPTCARAPYGVQTYRRVRWISDAPDRISPELRGECARYAPGLTGAQRVALATSSTPDLRGECARFARGLTPEQRIALAADLTPELRGLCARHAPGLTGDQRYALAAASTPDLRGWCARYAPDLTGDQRYSLAAASTEYWRGRCARDAPDLTGDQRYSLAAASTEYWRGACACYAPGLTGEQRAELVKL